MTLRNFNADMSNIFVYSILRIMLGTGKMLIFLKQYVANNCGCKNNYDVIVHNYILMYATV